MDILKYVDILVGLALVMVLASSVVTAVTQMITAATFARSRHLRDGVAEIVKQLHPELKEHAGYIAEMVLRHPMVARPNTWLGKLVAAFRKAKQLPDGNPATVIQREELIRILLEWAGDQGPLAAFANDPAAPEQARKAMAAIQKALSENGIANAGRVLSDIGQRALAEEQANPALSSTERHTRAVLATAATPFTGKIFSWFDNSMQRISDHFTLEAKIWTSAVALLVVVSIQLDSARLLRRLSQDESYRSGLVEQAKSLDSQVQTVRGSSPPPANLAEIEQRVREEREKIDATLATMRSPNLDVIPNRLIWERVLQVQFNPASHGVPDGKPHTLELQAGDETTSVTFKGDPVNEIQAGLAARHANAAVYLEENGAVRMVALKDPESVTLRLDNQVIAAGYKDWDLGGLWQNWPGLILSWVLLSLGAPFWFDALKNLLKFRSVLAQREDKERDIRIQAQPAPEPPAAKAQGA